MNKNILYKKNHVFCAWTPSYGTYFDPNPNPTQPNPQILTHGLTQPNSWRGCFNPTQPICQNPDPCPPLSQVSQQLVLVVVNFNHKGRREEEGQGLKRRRNRKERRLRKSPTFKDAQNSCKSSFFSLCLLSLLSPSI